MWKTLVEAQIVGVDGDALTDHQHPSQTLTLTSSAKEQWTEANVRGWGLKNINLGTMQYIMWLISPMGLFLFYAHMAAKNPQVMFAVCTWHLQ